MLTKKEYKKVNNESDGESLKNENNKTQIKVNLFCLIFTGLICGIILLFIGFSVGMYLNNYFNINNNDHNIDHTMSNAGFSASISPWPPAPSSDYRLKYDIKLLNDNINPYKNIGLNYYSWKWKNIIPNNVYIDNEYINDESFGVIAQEVLSLYPDAVTVMNDGHLGVYYSLLDEYAKDFV